ncbi:hypothetical protein HYH03_002684 [Edaphochlamys debaryana]|uniref:High light inducible protein n=1 Tax=Edaphochlamys debaryana TaxID=47281 RepID=A0A836C5I9_9CHLO|nr:hypothetical protein HYH03_002684 [Edaphochlamys debaryana]|eukprot:KAG2499752.1 hypothetical protein HYH03_002684 [Edaphochlamys debaryana]
MATALRACPVACPASGRRQGTVLRRSINRSARVVSVRAEAPVSPVKPPAGVTLPPVQPEVPPPMFGFVNWAEKINGRAAMLGFFGVLFIELIAGKGVLELAGLATGRGLGFEF